ncbi:hypothetical protein [Haloarcula pellucida]|uniref:Transmembrane protein n=1 Tax=Haloarcula pellucida TaxID=1427151 RepID=A0A830GP69_9EURY|nr:hypothetical protein [Halomicroarcula pellucida]MBX0350064.1 hypothetical protein [Halomicroarcula pellucida]GGO00253.1 hypothetical protein GCM10009030_32660 [Halomicroarcula pellucida]
MYPRTGDGERDGAGHSPRASLAIAVAVTLLGVGALAGLVYAEVTTTVTRVAYEDYRAGCADLAGETRLVDGGLGIREITLNETHVRRCENTTDEEYRQQRRQSLQTAPIGLAQWFWYGSMGALLTGGGVLLLRRELGS